MLRIKKLIFAICNNSASLDGQRSTEQGLRISAVRNAEGAVIASVSASGPSFRNPAGRIPALAAAVIRAADEVSRRLGWAAR